MKKIKVSIGSKDFDVFLDDDSEDFDEFLKDDIGKILNKNNVIDIKDLLDAYVHKCFYIYQQKKSIDTIALKISEKI
ncbi:MAG: hypothetical protein CR967_03520 [Proteobacteria bacterium]|nr:MAG: hypothetical protein CR967_03520 [Pseudomonadota bacterium]